jgi:hypothetical protein
MGLFGIVILSLLALSIVGVIILSGRDKSITGWDWIVQADHRYLKPMPGLRNILKFYFKSRPLEMMGKGRIYRLLGVHLFGKIIPTGGILIRRLTGWKMPAYTLAGFTAKAAKKFRYNTCMYEYVHFTAIIAQLPTFADGFLTDGIVNVFIRYWWNLPVNIYPIMYQRYTRVRIWHLIRRCGDRSTTALRTSPCIEERNQ